MNNYPQIDLKVFKSTDDIPPGTMTTPIYWVHCPHCGRKDWHNHYDMVWNVLGRHICKCGKWYRPAEQEIVHEELMDITPTKEEIAQHGN